MYDDWIDVLVFAIGYPVHCFYNLLRWTYDIALILLCAILLLVTVVPFLAIVGLVLLLVGIADAINNVWQWVRNDF